MYNILFPCWIEELNPAELRKFPVNINIQRVREERTEVLNQDMAHTAEMPSRLASKQEYPSYSIPTTFAMQSTYSECQHKSVRLRWWTSAWIHIPCHCPCANTTPPERTRAHIGKNAALFLQPPFLSLFVSKYVFLRAFRQSSSPSAEQSFLLISWLQMIACVAHTKQADKAILSHPPAVPAAVTGFQRIYCPQNPLLKPRSFPSYLKSLTNIKILAQKNIAKKKMYII